MTHWICSVFALAASGGAVTSAVLAFTAAAQIFNPRFDGVTPSAVARPVDAMDVRNAIRFTVTNDVPVRARSGGHSYAGYSTLSDGLVLDLRNLNSITVDKQGRVLVGYADGCVDACITAGPNSFTALATIARQVNGKRLFAQYDVSGPPAAPYVTGKALASPPSNVLSWQTPEDHGSAITGYNVYRRTGTGAYSRLASVPASALSYSDTAITSGQAYA